MGWATGGAGKVETDNNLKSFAIHHQIANEASSIFWLMKLMKCCRMVCVLGLDENTMKQSYAAFQQTTAHSLAMEV